MSQELNNYYPFGLPEAGRSWSYQGEIIKYQSKYQDYTYGYNGMQRDNAKGVGSGYTTLFREYDPEIARWKSLDPKLKDFPSESPFSAMGNNPITNTDVLGDKARVVNLDYKNSIGNMIQWPGISTPYELKHLHDYSFNGTYISMTNSQSQMISLLLNGMIPEIRKVLPRVADRIEKKDIRVAIVEGLKSLDSSPKDDETRGASVRLKPGTIGSSQIILLNINIGFAPWLIAPIKNPDYNDIMRTLVHEITHDMGYGEFVAYSTRMILGLQTMTGFYQMYKNSLYEANANKNQKDLNYWMNGMPEWFKNKWLVNNEVRDLDAIEQREFSKDAANYSLKVLSNVQGTK